VDDAGLSPDTRLRLEPGLRTRFDAHRHLLVESPGGAVVDTGPSGFAILSHFTPQAALGDVVEQLEHESDHSGDVVTAMGVIKLLVDTGALVATDEPSSRALGWADPIEQARMLHDRRRTSDYLAAIEAAVRPGDVVLDIGTGSGVLAVAAARAGARHVYAVEATGIGEIAAQVFAANGVADRITLITGWSERIDLPEPADVLVAELIGSEPLEENILETTLDARHRLLTPEARLVPHALTLVARPLVVPDAEAGRRAFGASAVAQWRRWYDIDFTALLDLADERPVLEPSEGEVVATWTPVGPPTTLATVDLGAFTDPSLQATGDLVVHEASSVNAISVTFHADLHEGISHTLDPWRHPASSWATAVWFLPNQLMVGPDARVRIGYRRAAYGTPQLECRLVPKP